MLEIKKIRENKSELLEALAKRGVELTEQLDSIIQLDQQRRSNLAEAEELKHQLNSVSKKIGEYFKSGNREEADKLKLETSELKSRIKELDSATEKVQEQLNESLYEIPNAPHPQVPSGVSETDNEVVFQSDHKLDEKEGLKPHWEIAESRGIIDFETGVKITGAGFPVYRGKGAQLQRALINFFLREASQAGYEEVQVPHLVNEDSGKGTGQLPDKEGQMYHTELDHLYLIPTAEVPITNMYRDVILDHNNLPVKNCGYTPCFRREAGSYGKDVRGLNRLHQFDKVEIVQVVDPKESYQVLEAMLAHSRSLLEKLDLPYRVLKLCGGDLGFTSALTYDLEVWSAGQKRWLEVSSVSNFETFQANRLKLRYRDDEGKPRLAHTLNGSALALPRIVAAILENYQDGDSVVVPEVLRSFTGFDKI
jgi:seryl-tRNA synthetase